MDVLRLTNSDAVNLFLRNGDAGDVAYVDSAIMPAVEDWAFNVNRSIVSRRSGEYPDLHQVRVNGAKVKPPRSIERVILSALSSADAPVTITELKTHAGLSNYSLREIKGVLSDLEDEDKVVRDVRSGANGGRPSVRYFIQS